MNRLSILVCWGISVALLACTAEQRPDVLEQAAQAREQYDSFAKQMVHSVQYIGGPLKDLNEEQMASLGALLMITRVVAQSEAFGLLTEPTVGEFWTEVDGICPPMPQAPEFRYGNCLDEGIAYASAMQRCLDEGKAEAECERLAAPQLAAAVVCEMRKLEEMRGVIGGIPGRRWPPGPFPWPEAGGPPTGGRP